VDDSLLVSGVYWNVFFKNLAFMYGESVARYVPFETDRTPAASGGATTVFSRKVMAMHPHGFAWQETGAVTETFPTIVNIASTDEWARVVSSVKNVGFTVLKTTG
jgi:hypothetical protein